MNIIKIVVALICAYGLFVSISYLLARLIFPKIEINEEEERERMLKTIKHEANRAVRRQKNLAY